MLKSNEILTLYAILKKCDCKELRGITECCMDEFVLKHYIEVNTELERVRRLDSERNRV